MKYPTLIKIVYLKYHNLWWVWWISKDRIENIELMDEESVGQLLLGN